MAETTLFDSSGAPVAYIVDSDENTIYSFAGEPLAYIDGEHVYGFNGSHIGWFQEGTLWNHSGTRAGFTKNTLSGFTQFEPFKGFKQFKPFKGFKQFAPFQPFKNSANSKVPLYDWLALGRT
jgi:hypothetical protein